MFELEVLYVRNLLRCRYSKRHFYREGIEYLYCRNKFNIIDDTIRIFVELKIVILIHGNFNK